MIEFDNVSIRYSPGAPCVVDNVNLTVAEGEFILVVGGTGSGKSTLLGAINGLVPHFTGGVLTGDVRIDGRSLDQPTRDLADLVGVVPQDPMASFVTDTVEEELAYTMECLGIAPRDASPGGGDSRPSGPARTTPTALADPQWSQRQRAAIGAVLTAHPRVLVLDEPTSALDPGAAEEVLAALHRLVHDLGVTVVLAEHRLERVLQYADRIIALSSPGGPITIGSPADVMSTAPIAPPVVHLGRVAGWSPTPITVRDARRQASTLRQLLVGHVPPVRVIEQSTVAATTDHLEIHYGTTRALRSVSTTLHRGEVIALMGRNGAGKSTMLHSLVGMAKPTDGSIDIAGVQPSDVDGPELIRRVGLVPQEPADLLEAATVAEECAASDKDAGATPEQPAHYSRFSHPRSSTQRTSRPQRGSATVGVESRPGGSARGDLP